MSAQSNSSDESEKEKYDRLFRELPKLGSPDYLRFLKEAPVGRLPAPVLARAFRELMAPTSDTESGLSRAAEATLARLFKEEHEGTYFRALRNEARRLHSEDDWFDLEDLIFEAKQEVGMVLGSDRGATAHQAWGSFQVQRVYDAWRALNGRKGERKEPERVWPAVDLETGEETDPLEVTGEGIPWHGRVGPDVEGWLHDFALRVASKIENPAIRGVAIDQWGDNPSKISSTDESDTSTLAHRYGVDRFKINRWLKTALLILRAALKKQDEMEIDVSWINP